VGLAVWAGYEQLLVPTSLDAVINARVTIIRAPIDGIIAGTSPLAPGVSVGASEILGSISDARADDDRLFGLRQALSTAQADLTLAQTQQRDTEKARDAAKAEADAYREGRVRQTELRLEQSRATEAAKEAKSAEAQTAFQRAAILHSHGFLADAALDQLRAIATAARQDAVAQQHASQGLAVELTAARSGTFLGDSFNDAPASLQRARELDLRIADARSTIENLGNRIERLKSQIDEESARFDLKAHAPLIAPAEGPVWEVFARPGEYVHKGQELLSILDCTTSAVTATVGERDYNKLRLGDPVRFRVSGTDRSYDGQIVRLGALNGPATAQASYAIAGDPQGRGVVIALPTMSASLEDKCAVGRSGRAVFGEGGDRRSSSPAATARSADLVQQ
jgi:multidrug resistance efflux pump